MPAHTSAKTILLAVIEAMIPAERLWLFCLASLLLALTPGPNWLYLVSRTLAWGRAAGMASLCGTTAGGAVHMVAAAFGLSALLLAWPMAFDVIRFAGASYLVWLALATLSAAGTPGVQDVVPAANQAALFRHGFLTGILNPKVALFYLALFPQFLDPARGSLLAQSLSLGAIQIAIVVVVDAALVALAGLTAARLAQHPRWMSKQRWVLGSAFGVLAGWLLVDSRRP